MSVRSGVAPSAEAEPRLRHLQAELARIDLLIQREVLRWQVAGQDPDDRFRGLHISDAEAEALAWRPLGMSWGQLVSLGDEAEEAFGEAYAGAVRQVEALVAESGDEDPPRLVRLASAFELDRFDVDTLLICLAPSLDLRYERLYGYLQDDVTRKRPQINLVLDLLCDPGPERWRKLSHLTGDGPLFRYRFLERLPATGSDHGPLLGQALRVDPALVTWMMGGYQPHAGLASHAVLWQPPEEPDGADALLAAGIWPEMERALALERPLAMDRPLLAFHGVDQASQRAAARLLACKTGRPLLSVDLAAVVGQSTPPLQALRLALRDARLTGAIPYLEGWDECLLDAGGKDTGEAATKTVAGSSPSPELLAELCAFPDWAAVAGHAAWQAAGIDRDRTLLWFDFPAPDYLQRRALWQHYLGGETSEVSGEPQVRTTSEVWGVSSLAGQFALTSGQIRDAVASARDRAAQAGRPLAGKDLYAAARAHSSPYLGSLALKIEPRYSWDDIILPGDQLALLHEIVATVRGRPQVLEEWGVGRKLASSSGVTMLFSGEAGTGKTMAAEIMAAELGLDLYKIDLSTVVSKYIGETEKNLERIFGEAQNSNAILFFDEADAIFGKRSEVRDAHDRYANIEISYLLQRMERYDGVTILATNLRANLDEAFTRRLQFAVDFPFPEEADRRRIWETLFPPGVPREPDLDFDSLARRFKLAGGNIRNILVGAAYLAAADGNAVTMEHLLHGTRRELQKMGRLVSEGELAAR